MSKTIAKIKPNLPLFLSFLPFFLLFLLFFFGGSDVTLSLSEEDEEDDDEFSSLLSSFTVAYYENFCFIKRKEKQKHVQTVLTVKTIGHDSLIRFCLFCVVFNTACRFCAFLKALSSHFVRC